MGKGREIRCYEYVNHPYTVVRDALSKDAASVFQVATKGAASRATSIAAELRVNVGLIEVAKEITIDIRGIEQEVSGSTPVTRLHLEWQATDSPHLFPLMNAQLSVYPLTPTETQLDFAGLYKPPAGAIGGAIDSVVGHRIAEVSVHRFVADVATYLRSELTSAE